MDIVVTFQNSDILL